MFKTISYFMLFLLVLFGAILAQPVEKYYKGKAGIKASPSIISMPASVWGIVIDTSNCIDCEDTIPAYRFLGDVLVDSILYNDSVRFVDCPERMQGISIGSAELQSVIRQVPVFRVYRVFRGVTPGDTLHWNSVTQKMDVLPDLSWHYHLRFNPDIPVDSVIALLATIDGLASYGGEPIPVLDIIDDVPESDMPGMPPGPDGQ